MKLTRKQILLKFKEIFLQIIKCNSYQWDKTYPTLLPTSWNNTLASLQRPFLLWYFLLIAHVRRRWSDHKTKSGHTKSGHTNSGNTKSGHTKSGHIKSGHTKSGHTKCGHTKSGLTKLGHKESGKRAWRPCELRCWAEYATSQANHDPCTNKSL